MTAWLPATTLDAGRDANLRRALELARLEFPSEHPIGWFRSKHQGEARLTTEEIEAVGHLIPVGAPLALVLRPSTQRPLRVASYFAVPGVALAGERPFQEFFVHPDGNETPQAVGPADFDMHVVAPLSGSVPVPSPGVRSSIGARAKFSSRFQASLEGLRWALPAGMLIVTAIAGLAVSRLPLEDRVLPFAVTAKSTAPVPVIPEPLRISASGNQWVVRWDARPAVQRATLVVTHADKKDSIALTSSQYASGSYSVTLPVGVTRDTDVEVLLRAQQASEEFSEVRTRVVGSATTLPVVPNAASRLAEELDRVKLELQAERNRRQRLLDMMVQAQSGAGR